MKKVKPMIPLVSVLLPCYNTEKYVEESVRSMMNQSYENLELILIDDCSTDYSYDILKKLAEEDKRIKLYRNEKNQRLIKTLNKGLKLCTGKYIARMDADDISLPNRIEEQVSFMERNNEVVACGSYQETFGQQKKKIIVPTDDFKIRQIFPICSPIMHPTVILRKEVIIKNNLSYDENYEHAEDYKFWFSLMAYGKLANIPQVLLKYRVSFEQISYKHNLTQQKTSSIIRREYVSYYLLEEGIEWELPEKITLSTIKTLKKLNKVEMIKSIICICYLSLHKYSISTLLYFLFSLDWISYPYNTKEFIRVIYKHIKPSRWESWL